MHNGRRKRYVIIVCVMTNHLTAAFSDMMQEVLACMDTKKLTEQDTVRVFAQMKEELGL